MKMQDLLRTTRKGKVSEHISEQRKKVSGDRVGGIEPHLEHRGRY